MAVNMFSKQLLLMLLLGILQEFRCQEGYLITSPKPAVVPKGSNVTFECRAEGDILWMVDNSQIISTLIQQAFVAIGIFAPFRTPNYSEVVVNAREINNGTTFQCLVVVGIRRLNESDAVPILVYDEPSLPFNLSLTLPPKGLEVMLSWKRGVALEGEMVRFVVTSNNVDTLYSEESLTNETWIALTPPPMGRECPLYNFTVQSENDFSRSESGVSVQTRIPTVPYVLDNDDITTVVSLPGPSITLSFDAPSPCMEFSVEEYLLMFAAANSVDMETSSVFNISHFSNEGRVFLEVTSSDGLRPERLYDVTIKSINSAGSSPSHITLSTTNLQSSSVIFDISTSSANISCYFADGATVSGCHASFGTRFNYSVPRGSGSTVAMETIAIELNLLMELSMLPVTVAEIYSDGTTSSFTIQADIITIQPTIQPTTTSSSPNSTATGNSILQENTLFIIIGGIAGVILLLLLIIITVICVIRSNHSRNKNLRSVQLSPEELNSNYVHGKAGTLPYLTGVNEVTLDNGQQARCNTYDNPHLEGANGGVTPAVQCNAYDTPAPHIEGANGGVTPVIPMYETIQSAKKGMLAAGGPAVLNPVYGSAGTSQPPASPPPCKAAPNPVYSETNMNSHQIVDVSGLNPIYADIGKQEPRPQVAVSDPGGVPRYANTIVQGGTADQATSDVKLPNPIIRRADSAGYPPPTPMYEELKTAKRLNSVGGAKDEDVEIMMRNESYGLLGMSDLMTSTQPLDPRK